MLAVIDGFPAGLTIDCEAIDAELRRRQGGYGRGGRQKLETDRVDVLSGIWQGVTLGSPICLQVVNKDYKLERLKELPRPRPGHGDLSGSLKYLSSIRGILERASARETAARVAAGALAQQLLAEFGIEVLGYVVQLGGTDLPCPEGTIDQQRSLRDRSDVYSLQPDRDPEICQLIDDTREAGDTLGGVIEVRVEGLPFGLGTHAQWDRKLDGRLAAAVMSVQAIKGVEIGLGFRAAALPAVQRFADVGISPSDQSCRRTGSRNDQRPAIGDPGRHEAHQHLAKTAGIDRHANQTTQLCQLRTKRHLRRSSGQRYIAIGRCPRDGGCLDRQVWRGQSCRNAATLERVSGTGPPAITLDPGRDLSDTWTSSSATTCAD